MLAGVVAAAVAIPLFALGGGSGGSSPRTPGPTSARFPRLFESRRRAWSGRPRSGRARLGRGRQRAGVGGKHGRRLGLADRPEDREQCADDRRRKQSRRRYAGGGFVWVANSLAGTVTKIDPNYAGSGGVVDTIPVGNGPTAIVLRARTCMGGELDRPHGDRIDPVSDRALPPLPIGAGARAVALGFGLVWVAGGNSVTRIDPRSRTVLPAGSRRERPERDRSQRRRGLGRERRRRDRLPHRPYRHRRSTCDPGRRRADRRCRRRRRGLGDQRPRARSLAHRPLAEKVTRRSAAQPPEAVASADSSVYLAVGASGVGHRGGTLTAFMTPEFDSIDPDSPTPWSRGR